MYRIHTGELEALQTNFQNTNHSLQQLFTLQNQLRYKVPYAYTNYVTNLEHTSRTLQQDITKLIQYFQTSTMLCAQSENQLQNLASTIDRTMFQTSSLSVQSQKQTNSNFRSEVLRFTHRFHTTFQKNRNLIGYIKNGACIGYFAGIDIWKGQYDKKMKYASFGGKLSVGSVDMSVDAKAMLFKDGKINPSLQLEAQANASVAQASIYGKLGNSYLNIQGEATGSVGCASGEAKAVINRDEITMKASVGAAALRGEVKGTLSIFGVKISATGIGEVGSVGASAEFSSKKGEFEFGTKASFLAGLGFKIHVTY